MNIKKINESLEVLAKNLKEASGHDISLAKGAINGFILTVEPRVKALRQAGIGKVSQEAATALKKVDEAMKLLQSALSKM